MLPDVIKNARAAGITIPEEMAAGLLQGGPALVKALEQLFLEADQYMPHSNAKRGPFSRLTKSGAAFVDSWATGVLGNNSAVDAVHHVFTQVARLMPRSDAETGPLAGITKSGAAFGLTFADGITSETDTVVKAADVLTGALMDRTESMQRRYGHNLRILRDSTDNLWWQTASIPGAAMRFAADVALDGATNATSAATNLTDSLSQWAQAYAIDAEAVAKAQEATQKELTNTLTAWAEFYALDAAAYDEWVKGKNLEDMLVEWSAFYALDLAAMEAYTAEKAAIQKRLVEDLSAWASFYALDAAETAEQCAEKVDSVWAQLAMYTAIRWASINGGVEEAIKKLAAWLPPELQQAVVGPLQQAFQRLGIDSKAGMEQMAQQIMDNLAATHPFIASTVKKLEEFVAKVQNMPGPIGNALKGVATAFKTLGEAIQKSFGEMAANALITYFDQLAAGEKTLQDFRGAMKAFLLDFVTMVEKQVLAAQAAGIATAIAQAPMTFGASLAQIPPILAQAAASLAVFEGIKAFIRAIPDNADQGVPALASGGIVTKPTLALIGEAGPEAVIPLSRGRRGSDAGGIVVNVTVTGNNISGDREADALARKVAQSITDQLRRQGIKPAYSY